MMWEQIQVNKRNSVILMALLMLVLGGLGFLIGAGFGGDPAAGFVGVIVATAVWLVMLLISFSSGDQILLASSRAQPVTPEVHPQLFNIVEEMKIAAALPKLPKIYIINDPSPNAFATGRSPERASVAVTAGLLSRLNRDELQGVIAHEVSHIVHRDILYVTLAGIMLGSIVLLSQVFLRSQFYGSMFHSRRYSDRSGRNQGQAVFLVIALLAAIVAPLFAQILYFSLSRKREYLADAGAVRLTRYPEGLASALEKIAGTKVPMQTANKVTAPMFIASPFLGGRHVSLFSTHPPIEERIRILRNMSHGASLKDYERSYEAVTKRSGMIPPSGLKEESVEVRGPSEDVKLPASQAAQVRKTGDLMRKVSGFSFIECPCGVKLKIPPKFPAPQAKCPRCGRIHSVREARS